MKNWRILNNTHKQQIEDWKNKEKEMMAIINMNESKQNSLQERVKDLEIIL